MQTVTGSNLSVPKTNMQISNLMHNALYTIYICYMHCGVNTNVS